jgi:hypothetical protein
MKNCIPSKAVLCAILLCTSASTCLANVCDVVIDQKAFATYESSAQSSLVGKAVDDMCRGSASTLEEVKRLSHGLVTEFEMIDFIDGATNGRYDQDSSLVKTDVEYICQNKSLFIDRRTKTAQRVTIPDKALEVWRDCMTQVGPGLFSALVLGKEGGSFIIHSRFRGAIGGGGEQLKIMGATGDNFSCEFNGKPIVNLEIKEQEVFSFGCKRDPRKETLLSFNTNAAGPQSIGPFQISSGVWTELQERIDQLERQGNENLRRSIPKGIVAAFDGQVCPAGWRSMAELSGRVIVGSGTGQTDQKGNPLNLRTYKEAGGEESHLMAVNEVAPHTHKVFRSAADMGGDARYPNWHYMSQYNAQAPTETTLGPEGQQVPMNQMQPFYVLTYCVKD